MFLGFSHSEPKIGIENPKFGHECMLQLTLIFSIHCKGKVLVFVNCDVYFAQCYFLLKCNKSFCVFLSWPFPLLPRTNTKIDSVENAVGPCKKSLIFESGPLVDL